MTEEIDDCEDDIFQDVINKQVKKTSRSNSLSFSLYVASKSDVSTPSSDNKILATITKTSPMSPLILSTSQNKKEIDETTDFIIGNTKHMSTTCETVKISNIVQTEPVIVPYIKKHVSTDKYAFDAVTANTHSMYQKKVSKWINSDNIMNCQSCKTIFGIFTRKHHCRACGGVFCWYCCNKNIYRQTKDIDKPQEKIGII